MEARQALIRDFINGLNDAPWWHMDVTYTDGYGNHVSRNIHVTTEHPVSVPLEDDDRYWFHHDRIVPSEDTIGGLVAEDVQ